MGGFNSLDIEERAAALGIGCREYIRLGQTHPGIYAYPMLETDGAVARFKRWHAAGCPSADVSRLEFCGSDTVRALVANLLRRVPAPVGWHGAEHVAWVEVGRNAWGWHASAPVRRDPDGDQAHMIMLNGAVPDEDLAPIVGHELGHAWRAPVRPFASAHRVTDHETAARSLAAFHEDSTTIAETIETLVRMRVAEERGADELATLWGFPFSHDYQRLARMFRAEYEASAERAEQVERETAADLQGAA